MCIEVHNRLEIWKIMISDSDKQAKARQIIEEKKKLLAERVQKQNEERKKQEKQKELEKQKKQLEKFKNAKGWQPAKQKEIEKENVQVIEIAKIETLPPFVLHMKPLIPPLSVNEEPQKSITPDSQMNYEEDFEDETPIESSDELKEETPLNFESEIVDDLEESSLCNFKCSETDFPKLESVNIIEEQPKSSFHLTLEPSPTNNTQPTCISSKDPIQSLSEKQKDWHIEITETEKLIINDSTPKAEYEKQEKLSKVEEIPNNDKINDIFTIEEPVTIVDHTAYFPEAPMLMNFNTFGENFYSKKNKSRYGIEITPELRNQENIESTPNEIDVLIDDLENENARIDEDINVLIGDLTQVQEDNSDLKPKKGELILIDYDADEKKKEKFELFKKKKEIKNERERKNWNQAIPVPISQQTSNSPKPQKRVIETKIDSKDHSPRENIKHNQNQLTACIQKATRKVSSCIEAKNDSNEHSPRRVIQNPENQLNAFIPRTKKSTSPNISPKPNKKQESSNLKSENIVSPQPPEQPKSRALTEEAKQAIASKYRRHKNLPNLVYNKPTNRKLIKKAITQVCCAGEPNRALREEAIEVIDKNEEVSYFIIVFKSELGRRDLRAIYSHDPNNGDVKKIYGPATMPEQLNSGMVKGYFRFDSGSNEFKPIECKDFITGTDAIVLKINPKIY
ncbi:unnamed protein product [Blepharisma stoltei]|uniref:CKK domain-containing protein n=1 Tax=Blepharisma stoltei TaxID=1481888 RepID=A0AAU9JLS2_9CILI|nr:unnamed protein product [Blepharisma stoltei]